MTQGARCSGAFFLPGKDSRKTIGHPTPLRGLADLNYCDTTVCIFNNCQPSLHFLDSQFGDNVSFSFSVDTKKFSWFCEKDDILNNIFQVNL